MTFTVTFILKIAISDFVADRGISVSQKHLFLEESVVKEKAITNFFNLLAYTIRLL